MDVTVHLKRLPGDEAGNLYMSPIYLAPDGVYIAP